MAVLALYCEKRNIVLLNFLDTSQYAISPCYSLLSVILVMNDNVYC